MATSQAAILADIPDSARFIVLGLKAGANPKRLLEQVAAIQSDAVTIIGLGAPLTKSLAASPRGLREFPAVAGPGVSFPSTQGALWIGVGGGDPGETLHRARDLVEMFGDAVFVQEEVLSFKYAGGRDLSGYEDGTENPKGKKAVTAALVSGAGPGMDGSSFVAVQRWVHDLARLKSYSPAKRDALVGRRQDTNEEIADAPASAHVKRAAQESFAPPAFILRRSMPWGNSIENGLFFIAYGSSLDAYEQVLKRMAGLEDGIVDGLFKFTRAVSGGYYWCPPLRDGHLDLRALAK
jgi:putative iron-dependent peroxidase